MIDALITCLIIAISLTVVIQPNMPRLLASMAFVLGIISHELFLSDLDGLAYYGTAAIVALVIILLTGGIDPVPRMVVRLHQICLASIGVNAMGWVIWWAHWPPEAYNLAMAGIFAWALWVLTERNGSDANVGNFSLDSCRACFRFNHFPIPNYLFSNKKKV